MNSFVHDAMLFAIDAHGKQERKYTGEPYWKHLAEVAGIVSTVACRDRWYYTRDEMIVVAWLHDTLEDTNASGRDIERLFGYTVFEGVKMLTDCDRSFGNRAARKAKDRERLFCAEDWIQTVKVADLISNTGSIVKHDASFARVYLDEKEALLDVLTEADDYLLALARKTLVEARNQLGGY